MDAELIGVLVMTPLSFLPAANAVLTLLVIKNYRNFLIRLICGEKLNPVGAWTTSLSNVNHNPNYNVSAIRL
jgi:hypothetical protein